MTDLNDLFIRAGRTLYGDSWQTQVARALEVSGRHIRRIVAGTAPAQPGMLMDLWRLMLERQAEMDLIIDEIKKVGSSSPRPENPDHRN